MGVVQSQLKAFAPPEAAQTLWLHGLGNASSFYTARVTINWVDSILTNGAPIEDLAPCFLATDRWQETPARERLYAAMGDRW